MEEDSFLPRKGRQKRNIANAGTRRRGLSRSIYIYLSLSFSLPLSSAPSLSLSLYGRRGVLNSVREVVHLRVRGTVPRLRAVTSRDSPLSLPRARYEAEEASKRTRASGGTR